MVGKIRGISIELSADTSGIVKGLKEADATIRKTQKELRDINKLLKLDPTNMTLLKQRTQALQTEIGGTSKKLQELKTLEKSMKAEGVDENSEQFKALQREIIETEQKLKQLESTAGSGSATMLAISNNAKKLGDGLQNAGKKLLPVTAGITALGAASVKAFKEVDTGADTVIKKTGATGEAAEELKGIYEEVATTVSGSFEDAGKAVGEINTRFGLTGDELTTLSQDFMKFAKITDQDVESAVIGVDHAMKTFGVATEDADGVLGLLAKTSQDTGISVETLEGLLQNSGDQLKEMGLGLTESVQLMGNFEKNGLDSNKMLSRLAKAAAHYSKEGKSMSEGLSDLIDGLQDSSTEADATAEAYKIFGKRAGLAFINAAKEGKLSFKGLSSDLTAYKDTVNNTYDGIIDETDKLELVWKNTKVALADAGKTILSSVAPAIQKLAGFVKDLSQKWKGLDDGTKKTIIKFAGIAAAVAPVLIILGKLATAISAVTKVMSTMKFASLLTNPVTIAIGALAGLVAGFLAIKRAVRKAYDSTSPYAEQLDDLQQRTSELAGSLEETEQKFKDSSKEAEAEATQAGILKDKLFELLGVEEKTAGQKELIKQYVEDLNEIVPNLGLAYDAEKDALNRTNEAIKENIDLRKLQAEAEAYNEFYSESLKERIQAEMDLNEATEAYQGALENCEPALKDYLDRVERGTISAGEAEVAAMRWGAQIDELSELKEQAKLATDNYNKAVENEKRAEEGASASAEKLADKQAEMANTLNSMDLSDFRTELENTLGKDVADRMNDAISAAEKAGVGIPDELKNGILSGEISVKKAIQTINKSVREKLASNRNAVKQEGIQSDLSYASGMEEKKASVKASAGKVANSADEGLQTGIAKAKTTGEATGSSHASGIESKSGESKSAGETNAGSAVSGLDTGIAPAGTSGASTGSSFATGVSNAAKSVGEAAAGLITSARNNMVGDASDLGETFGKSYGDGIANVGWYIGQKVVEIVGRAKEALQNAQESGSPSKVAMSLGNDFGEGYALGIDGTIKNAAKSAAALVQTPKIGNANASVGKGGVGASTFIQNNYSPRSLTASEIYRQTHNLISAKGY